MIFKKNNVKRSVPRKIGNGIIYFFLGLFVLIILFFGFSQTSTFRNIVRNKILEYTQETFSADFNLGSIEGTIITSLVLNDVSLVDDGDTIFTAKNISLGINPFPLLIQELNFTTFQIYEMDVDLIKEKSGEWNIAKIIRTDSLESSYEVDTLLEQGEPQGEFPFNIKINNLTFANANINLRKYSYKGSNNKYETINFDDLSIKQFNLQASAYADINSREFALTVDSLFFNPNLNNFNLLNLSGNFQLSEEYVEAKDLSIITDYSSLNLSARLDSLNLFGDIDLADFKDYPLFLKFRASPFRGSDLSSFLDAVDFMRGDIELDLEAEGSFGNFNHKANLKFERTDISMEGSLQNLHTPKKLYINANFTNSTVAYWEVDKFLKGLELPSYPDLVVENLNLQYSGEPLKFKAAGDGRIDDGNITFEAFMDMYPDLIEYDYKFTTNNINLNSTIGIPSNVNSSCQFKGKGFNPSESTSEMDLHVYNSFMDKYFFDSLDTKLLTTDQFIELEVEAEVNKVGTFVTGFLDLAESDNPIYNLQGGFKNLDLAQITEDSSLTSSLNFEFSFNGHSLDINETEGTFHLNFIDSRIGENEFDSIKFKLDMELDNEMRSISLQSDLLDFNLNGEYNLEDAYKLFNHQVTKINYSIGNKLEELNPLDHDEIDFVTFNELHRNEYLVEKELYLDYDFEFKDFRIIAVLLGRDEISISGLGDGYIENDSSNFSMSTNVDIDYLFLFKDRDVFFISDVGGSINIGVDNHSYSFDNIFGSLSFDSKRIVSGVNMDNLSADFVFNESRIYYNISGDIDENINTKLNGNVTIIDSIETITVDNFGVFYQDFSLENHQPLILTNSPQQFTIDEFMLYNNDSELMIDGVVNSDFSQDIKIQVRNLYGGLLGKYLFGFENSDDEFTVNLYSELSGTTIYPIITVDLAGEDIIINDKNLGSLYLDLNYQDKNLATQILFTDSTRNTSKPLLTMKGDIPIYLGLDPDNNQVDSTKNIGLKFITKDFNIASLGRLIPTLADQRGLLNSEVNISGSLSDLNYDGYMNLKNSTFTADVTNLDYGLDFEMNFNQNKIDVRNITLKNIGNSKYSGTMIAHGEIITEGVGIKYIDFTMDGDIALLSQASQETSRNLFGDLYIGTDKSLHYQYKNNRSKLSGTIDIKEANLNFVPTQSSYSVSGTDFKYVFVIDSSTFDKERKKYEKLLTALSLKYEDDEETSTIPKNFDLDLIIRSDNISKISIVLSKALNQKLIADVYGSLKIENEGDKLLAHGQFDILPSSMLTFYKTFQTEGNIKFTSDLSDPMINITASYKADYVNKRVQDAEPIITAVKIKINDKVSTLEKSIATGEDPIEMKIYMGQRNIDQDVASNQYNNLDAIYFILFGSFTSDVDNTDLANNAAMSVIGSTLTTMLNANFGDLVNNVNLNQSGDQTRINISGRVQKVRYTIGGTQEVFSDLSQANARVEYLVNPKLILRAERKDPVISSSSGNNDKISEFGIKYRFTF
ncbi:MAG: hypothetical protein ABFS12_05495 [Bacteroidota bacterium]